MTKTLLIISGAVILAAAIPIVSSGETGKGGAAPQGFDTPAQVGKRSVPSSAVMPWGSPPAGAVQATVPPASRSDAPGATPSPLPPQTDQKGVRASVSGLVNMLSRLVPTQEDLDKAFDSFLIAPERARLPGSRGNSDTK